VTHGGILVLDRFLVLLDQVDDVVEARVGLKALIILEFILAFEAEITRFDGVTGQRSLGHWSMLILACAR